MTTPQLTCIYGHNLIKLDAWRWQHSAQGDAALGLLGLQLPLATSLAWNEITRQLYVIDLYFTCVGSVGWREAERSASVNNGEAESARGMGCAWVVPCVVEGRRGQGDTWPGGTRHRLPYTEMVMNVAL